MRALIVTNMYPTPERPEYGRFVLDQVEALRRRGDVEVEVFAFPPGLRSYPAAARALRRRYRRPAKFDVVHAHFGLTAWPALLAAPRAGRRHAARQRPLPPALEPDHARALPFTALPAAVSREFSENLPGAGTTRRVAVLPVGIDLERFRPIPRARRASGSGSIPTAPTCCSRTTPRGR